MPERESTTGDERSTSFLDICKSVIAATTSALHTRLELLVTELEKERERLKQTLLLTLLLFSASVLSLYFSPFLRSRCSCKRAGFSLSEGSRRSTSASESLPL